MSAGESHIGDRSASPVHMSRRSFLRCAGASLAAVSLGPLVQGCTDASPGVGARSSAPDQLVYQDWRTDWFPGMVQEQLDRFHTEHPSIRVFYTPDPEDYLESMTAAMEAGTAPDVFQGCCAHFPAWAQRGYTLDLRPLVDADLGREVIDDWDPAQYASFFTPEGLQFGVPKYHGALALYYNQDLFDAARVPYPDASWDYDDYRAAMVRLTADADGDGATDVWGSMVDISWDRLQVHVNGWGGHLVDPVDPRRSGMASSTSLEALGWIRDRMWEDRIMASFPDVGNLSTRDAFAAGKLAMVEDGSWALQDLLQKSAFRVGVAPFPAGPARRVTLASTDGFGIYAGTRHPEAAWELVKFLAGRDYGRAMARAGLLQPARLSLVDDWVGFVRARFPKQSMTMEPAVFADGMRKGYSVTAEIFPGDMASAERIADAAWQRVFTLGQGSLDDLVAASSAIEEAQGIVPSDLPSRAQE